MGAITSLISLAVVIAIIISVARLNNINDLPSLYNWAFKKSEQLRDCVNKQYKDCESIDISIKRPDSTPNTPVKPVATKEEARTLVDSVNVGAPNKNAKYDRKEWSHWSNVGDSKCWNIREEILKRDGKDVKLLDKNKKETTSSPCYIVSGTWYDPYSGENITSASMIDIDHIVPLNYAVKMGAENWDANKKQQFANDPDNLLAVSSRENRSKGAKGPSEYMPPNKAYHCEYATKFSSIVKKYNLNVTGSDKRALSQGIQGCAN